MKFSQSGIENEDSYQLRTCELDFKKNSHDYQTKKYKVLVRRMNVLILGLEGLKTFCSFEISIQTNETKQT